MNYAHKQYFIEFGQSQGCLLSVVGSTTKIEIFTDNAAVHKVLLIVVLNYIEKLLHHTFFIRCELTEIYYLDPQIGKL